MTLWDKFNERMKREIEEFTQDWSDFNKKKLEDVYNLFHKRAKAIEKDKMNRQVRIRVSVKDLYNDHVIQFALGSSVNTIKAYLYKLKDINAIQMKRHRNNSSSTVVFLIEK